MYSHRVSPEPAEARAAWNRRKAASGEATPTSALAHAAIAGYRRRQAAVMMPSVPSAPMKICFRS